MQFQEESCIRLRLEMINSFFFPTIEGRPYLTLEVKFYAYGAAPLISHLTPPIK